MGKCEIVIKLDHIPSREEKSAIAVEVRRYSRGYRREVRPDIQNAGQTLVVSCGRTGREKIIKMFIGSFGVTDDRIQVTIYDRTGDGKMIANPAKRVRPYIDAGQFRINMQYIPQESGYAVSGVILQSSISLQQEAPPRDEKASKEYLYNLGKISQPRARKIDWGLGLIADMVNEAAPSHNPLHPWHMIRFTELEGDGSKVNVSLAPLNGVCGSLTQALWDVVHSAERGVSTEIVGKQRLFEDILLQTIEDRHTLNKFASLVIIPPLNQPSFSQQIVE